MTYDEAQAEIRRLEAELEAAKSNAAAIRARDPRQAVGKCFRGATARALLPELMRSAESNAKWLAQKCINDGPGAAHDSGEARIVVLLDELCQRLKERS